MHPKPRNDALMLSVLWAAFSVSCMSWTTASAAEMLPESVPNACTDETTQRPAEQEPPAATGEAPSHPRRNHATRVGGDNAPTSRSSRWNAYLPGMLR